MEPGKLGIVGGMDDPHATSPELFEHHVAADDGAAREQARRGFGVRPTCMVRGAEGDRVTR